MNKFLKNYFPLLTILALTFIFFSDFFLKGHLLEGAGDRIKSSVPLEILSLRSFNSFKIPQWNPHLYCGVPYINTGYHNFFYPINWIIYSLGEKNILLSSTAFAMLNFILAGGFFYLFSFSLVKDRFWALLSAITYTFSFTLTYNMVYGSDCVVPLVFFPLILYLINTAAGRKPVMNFIYLTLSSAMLVTGGNIQLILYIGGLSTAYALYKSINIQDKKVLFNKKLFLVFFYSMAMAGLITFIRILPFLISTLDFKSAFLSSFAELAKFDLTKNIALFRFFAPFFFSGENGFFMAGLGPPNSFNVYFGILAAYLILYAFIFIWDKESFFWKISITAIILIILGTPLAKLQYYLTGQAYLSFSRYAWLLPMPCCILLGIAGVKISNSHKGYKKLFILSAIVFAIVITSLYLIYRDTAILSGKVTMVKPERYLIKEYLLGTLLRNMRYSMAYFSLGTLYFFILMRASQKAPSRKTIIKLLVLAFAAVDLLSMAKANITSLWPFLSKAPFKEPLPDELKLSKLFADSKKSFRVLGQSNNTSLDEIIRFGLYKPTGWGASIPYHLAELYSLENTNRISSMDRMDDNPRIYELTSTGYKLNPNGSLTEFPKYMPRVKLFNNYVVIDDSKAAKNLLVSPKFDIYKNIVLASRPNMSPISNIDAGQAKILSDENERIKISVDAKTDAILLMSDSFYPGWQAFIDGKKAKILRANVAFKAVEIPQGKHEVTFIYKAPGLILGMIISIISIFIFAGISISFIFRPKSL